MSYEYVIATESDRATVREALAKYFYPEEPLTLAHRNGADVTMDDMETALSFLGKGTTILARADGAVVGLAIGGLSTDVSAVPITTQKYGDIVAFLECLSARAFNSESSSSSYHVYILAVHPAHRGHSIGRRLMEKQIDLARARWPSLLTVTVEATSATSLRLMKRIGMRETARLSFAEYRDAGGEQVFFGTGEAVRLKLQL